MSTLAVNRPCATCRCDRLHIGLRCHECGQDTQLKPLDGSLLPKLPSQLKKDLQRRRAAVRMRRLRTKALAVMA